MSFLEKVRVTGLIKMVIVSKIILRLRLALYAQKLIAFTNLQSIILIMKSVRDVDLYIQTHI